MDRTEVGGLVFAADRFDRTMDGVAGLRKLSDLYLKLCIFFSLFDAEFFGVDVRDATFSETRKEKNEVDWLMEAVRVVEQGFCDWNVNRLIVYNSDAYFGGKI